MLQRIRTTLRHDEGASAVEYGLLVAAIAAVIVIIVFTIITGGLTRRPTGFVRAPLSQSSGRPC